MCKYCENGVPFDEMWMKDDHRVFIDTFAGKPIIRITNMEDIDTDTRAVINFCPMCGTPLGEVKPLTVEQLRQMDGKPVFLETGEILINEQIIGRWNIIHSVSDAHAVFMGGGNGFRLDNYGTTWLAYLHEPKGEADYPTCPHD